MLKKIGLWPTKQSSQQCANLPKNQEHDSILLKNYKKLSSGQKSFTLSATKKQIALLSYKLRLMSYFLKGLFNSKDNDGVSLKAN